MREPSKPIFNKTEILTVHNVYRQRCVMETYKVVKYRMPITVYTLFDRSSRRDDRLILPFPNSGFIYRSSALWNKAVQATGPVDMALSFLTTKSIFCGSILTAQKRYSTLWCDLNFTEFAGWLCGILTHQSALSSLHPKLTKHLSCWSTFQFYVVCCRFISRILCVRVPVCYPGFYSVCTINYTFRPISTYRIIFQSMWRTIDDLTASAICHNSSTDQLWKLKILSGGAK